MLRYAKVLSLTIIFVLGVQAFAFALTNDPVFSQFQFNFITPGARATALGGAFIGLADDATAVESNPAGLTQLYDAEISAEFKYIAYTAERMYENFSVQSSDIKTKEFDDSVESIPFMSVVFPYKRVAFSFYRQELVNFETSYRTSQTPIILPGWTIGDQKVWFYPVDASLDLNVTNYGIGIAVQPFEGISLAVSPRWSRAEMTSFSKDFNADPNNESSNAIPTDFSEEQIESETKIDGADDDFSMNAGLLWRLNFLEEKFNIPRISIGAVYRSGGKFTLPQTIDYKTMNGIIEAAEGRLSWTDFYSRISDLSEFTLQVPDSFGFGIAIQPKQNLTFSFDVVHIRYEDLLEDFDINPASVADVTVKNNYTIDNATEIHLGMEYTLEIGERLLALRLGGYYEPDHTIRFTGTTANQVSGSYAEAWANFYDDIFQYLFPGGDDQYHITGGVGLAVSQHFQIDTAANIADMNKQFSVSAVYRF